MMTEQLVRSRHGLEVTMTMAIAFWDRSKKQYTVVNSSQFEHYKAGDCIYIKEDHKWVSFQLAFKRQKAMYPLIQKWTPAKFMKAKDAAIWLDIKSVTRKPIQEITRHEAIAEGISLDMEKGYRDYLNKGCFHGNPIDSFKSMWQLTHRKAGHRWEANPEIIIIQFKEDQK